MTQPEFAAQMDRLAKQWDRAYSSERARLFWDEVKGLSEDWFRRLVDEWIGSEAHAPLLPKVREAKAKRAERLHFEEKRQHSQDAAAFWKSSYHPEEEKILFQTMRARMNGEVSDHDWELFMRGLNSVASGGAA